MGTTVFARGAMLLASVIFCVVAPSPLQAEELTLPQAVEYALQNNGDLKSFREEKGLRDAGKIRAGLLPNPTLELEGNTGALSGSSAENSITLGLSQEFFLAGKREKRLALAEREQEIYHWQLADRKRMLREEVKTAFYNVILAQQRTALADRFIELNKQLLGVARERLTAGDIPELEMNLVKVELARSEGTRIDAEKTLIQSQARLYALMGLAPGQDPVFAGNFESELSLAKSLADLKQLASWKRPDLKVLGSEKNRGDADIVLARAEGIPNLTAGLAVKREETAMEVGGVEGRDTVYTIGLKLSMPIPLFDRNQAGLQEARARRNSSENRSIAAIRNVEREVESAYAGFLNTGKVLALYRTNIIPQLEENLKLTQEAYRLGETGVLSVIQEQKKFFEVNDGYLVARHEHQAAFVKLESATATEFSGGAQ